jgi:hypothetical protein
VVRTRVENVILHAKSTTVQLNHGEVDLREVQRHIVGASHVNRFHAVSPISSLSLPKSMTTLTTKLPPVENLSFLDLHTAYQPSPQRLRNTHLHSNKLLTINSEMGNCLACLVCNFNGGRSHGTARGTSRGGTSRAKSRGTSRAKSRGTTHGTSSAWSTAPSRSRHHSGGDGLNAKNLKRVPKASFDVGKGNWGSRHGGGRVQGKKRW